MRSYTSMLQLENISYAHNPMFLDNGCVSLYTITRSLAFWIQAARYYTICIILYHVHHQNRCYVATLIAMPILFTLPTYRYRPSTILYTNNSHKILINCKIYESRMKYLSKEESSCDMSGVKLQSIKIVDYLLKILGHRSSFLLVALCSNWRGRNFSMMT